MPMVSLHVIIIVFLFNAERTFDRKKTNNGMSFSEFEPRPNLDKSQMSFDYLMDYIVSISMCM